jgi:hypothetical protein
MAIGGRVGPAGYPAGSPRHCAARGQGFPKPLVVLTTPSGAYRVTNWVTIATFVGGLPRTPTDSLGRPARG